MNAFAANFTSALIVIVISCVLTAGIYAFVIPAFFPGYKTYLVLVAGIAIAALGCGYIGYQYFAGHTVAAKVGIGVCFAAVGAISVLVSSLFVILNVRGS